MLSSGTSSISRLFGKGLSFGAEVGDDDGVEAESFSSSHSRDVSPEKFRPGVSAETEDISDAPDAVRRFMPVVMTENRQVGASDYFKTIRYRGCRLFYIVLTRERTGRSSRP